MIKALGIIRDFELSGSTQSTEEKLKLACKGKQIELTHTLIVNPPSNRSQVEKDYDQIAGLIEEHGIDIVVTPSFAHMGRSMFDKIANLSTITDHLEKKAIMFQEGWEFKNHHVAPINELGEINTKEKANIIAYTALIDLYKAQKESISKRIQKGIKKRRTKGGKVGRPAGKSKLDPFEDQIKAMLEDGKTQKSIAEKYKCNQHSLVNWLKRKRVEWGWEK